MGIGTTAAHFGGIYCKGLGLPNAREQLNERLRAPNKNRKLAPMELVGQTRLRLRRA
jgi:hypothetical protein